MLIACKDCHRQYDTGSLEIGSKIRCSCGSEMTVPKVRARDVPAARCSSCGGQLSPGAKTCSYCGSEITISDRGYGLACPECFARLLRGAKFCSACGVPISPEEAPRPLDGKSCPRCSAALSVRDLSGGALTECSSCGGLWLEEGTFEQVTEKTEKHSVSAYVRGQMSDTQEADSEDELRYLKCPVCEQFMNRKNFAHASGVIIDWCRGHGYWFDRHELQRILEWIDEGGMDVARAKDLRRHEEAVRQAQYRAQSTREASYDRSPAGFGPKSSGGLFSILRHFIDGVFI